MHMRGVVPLADAPLPIKKIEEIRELSLGRASHILFIHNPATGERETYVIAREEDLEIAQEATRRARQITGYSMRVECGARSVDGEVTVGEYVLNLRDVSGWNVEVADQTSYFHVFFTWEGNDKQPGYAMLQKLENALVALSIKNKIGFEIRNVSWGPKYNGQPFAIWAGRPEQVPKPITAADIRRISQVRSTGSEDIFLDVVRYFSSVTPEQKIIFGFSILEKLFNTPPKQAFSKEEIDKIIVSAVGIETLSDDDPRVSQIRHALSQIFTKNRNQRLSEGISASLGTDEQEVYERVKELSRLRGRAAHTPQANQERASEDARSEISRKLPWIEDVFLELLGQKHD